MNTITNLKGHVFEQGYEILEKKGTAIVGISPENSYFGKENLEKLLNECTKRFSKIIVMIPDKPAVHTYKALGYNDIEAERKARLKSNAFLNRTNEILSPIQETYSGDIVVANWSSLVAQSQEYKKKYENILEFSPVAESQEYKNAFANILQLYENNPQFRKDARNTTKNVIEGKMKPGLDLEKSVDEGVKYLLSELTFVSACSKFYGTNVTYVYHNPWPIYENYVNGVYDNEKHNLGLVIMR